MIYHRQRNIIADFLAAGNLSHTDYSFSIDVNLQIRVLSSPSSHLPVGRLVLRDSQLETGSYRTGQSSRSRVVSVQRACINRENPGMLLSVR